MKTIVLILSLLIGRVSCVWADDLAIAASVPIVAQRIVTGVIKSVTWADSSKGTQSEIVVLDASRKTTHILVTPITTLWDKDAKAIMPDKIVAKKKVSVIYITTPEGVNVGKFIKILK